MNGSIKQIKWAQDIQSRAIKYKAITAEIEKVAGEEYRNTIEKIYKRISYIEKENDARYIIKWYQDTGIEIVGRKKISTYKKFITDIMDKEDAENINKLLEMSEMA